MQSITLVGDGVIISSMLSVRSVRQTVGGFAIYCPSMLISLWLVALLSLGNPLACLLHCWSQAHASASPTHGAVQSDTTQSHHGTAHSSTHEQPPATDQAPLPIESSPTFSCTPNHQSVSALTIAVLLALIWLVIPLGPGTRLTEPRLLLRFVTYPPPYPPPRFALISCSW